MQFHVYSIAKNEDNPLSPSLELEALLKDKDTSYLDDTVTVPEPDSVVPDTPPHLMVCLKGTAWLKCRHLGNCIDVIICTFSVGYARWTAKHAR